MVTKVETMIRMDIRLNPKYPLTMGNQQPSSKEKVQRLSPLRRVGPKWDRSARPLTGNAEGDDIVYAL